MNELTVLDLFSGIGGFSLAFQREGFRTIAFCEIEEYAQRVLAKNFGAVMADGECPRPPQPERSIKELRKWIIDCGENVPNTSRLQPRRGKQPARNNEGGLRSPAGIEEAPLPDANRGRKRRKDETEHQAPSRGSTAPPCYRDIRTLDGTQFRGVTVITGGFPCQPYSQAGKRRGSKDDRALWPQMLRIISEARPDWIVAENVAGFVSLVEFDRDLEMDSGGIAQGEIGNMVYRMGSGVANQAVEALESLGYTVQPFIVPACAVDARHRRDRIWIVANNARVRSGTGLCQNGQERNGNQFANGGGIASDNDGSGCREQRRTITEREKHATTECGCRWEPEPELGRVAHGIPRRVDRLKGLGNAIVPQVAQVFARMIREQISASAPNEDVTRNIDLLSA